MQNLKIQNKKNTTLTPGWWVLTIFTSFIISTIIIWIIHWLWHPTIADLSQSIPESINIFKTNSKATGLPTIKEKMVILAMGVDSNGVGTDPFNSTRTDTMVVAVLNPQNKTVNAISIPRDSKVYLADNKGIDKINAAHAYGGPELAIKTVEQTLGINIDHYIIVDNAGVKKIVEALGGIEVFVEKRMKYTDHSAKLFIDLQPGKQVLNAEQAEMYLRFRHDAEGDIGRIKRQQWFLKGLLQKIKDPSIVFKIPQLINVAKECVRTDMDISTMLQIAGFMKDVDLNTIQVATLPGNASTRSSISYWLIDVNKAQILVDRLIHGFEPDDNLSNDDKDKPITLSILYDNERKDTIDELVTNIETGNYKVVCKNTTKEVHTKIISHTNRATVNTTKQLRLDFNAIKDAPIFLSPKDVFCAPSDYTIVLGQDY